jgi:protein DGCR14
MSESSKEVVKTEKNETPITRVDSETIPIPPKPKQVILKEEDYVETIESILERDFFPDLPKLNNHLEWLEAVKNHDLKKMQEIQSRYHSKKSTSSLGGDEKPFETPNFAETPINKKPKFDPTAAMATSTEGSTLSSTTPLITATPSTHGIAASEVESKTQPNDPKKLVIENMSLDSFLNKFTSEDDASFSKIMEEAHEKHKIRYPWLHESQPTQRLAFEGPDSERPAGFLTWGHTARNALMYHPEGLPPTVEPEKVSAETKKILPENTRLRITFEQPKPQQPKKKEEVDVYKLLQDPVKLLEHKKKQKEVKVDLDDLRKTPAHSSSMASVPPSPQVNGWSFVATPSPAPGEDHEPFVTWGNIEGTPLLLSEPTDTPIVARDSEEPTFKVPELTKRELIALKLADQVQFKRKKKSTSQAGNSATMSPAAQKLLQSTLAQKMKSPEFSLRAAYNSPLNPPTPTRPITKGATSSLTPSRPPSTTKTVLTPVIESSRKKRKFSEEPPGPELTQHSLTDNLLFLPQQTSNPNKNTGKSDNLAINNNNPNSADIPVSNETNVSNSAHDITKDKKVSDVIEKQLRDKLESQQKK